QIGNALAGVHHVGFCDGTSWAGPEAQRAGPTEVGARFIWVQVDRGEDLSQEEPGAVSVRDQVGVLADPPEAGLLGPGLLHDRTCIHVPACLGTRGQGSDPSFQLFKSLLQNLMVVLSPRIPSDTAVTRTLI